MIATTTQELQAPLNKHCKQHIKRDNNLFFPSCYNFFIQKQLETIRIANLNVPNINNNKYCSLYLKA